MITLVEIVLINKKKFLYKPEQWQKLKSELSKEALALTKSVREVTLKEYTFEGWVHPKSGGDDYEFKRVGEFESDEEAMKNITSYLKRVSDVVDDFKLVSVK